MGKIFKVLGVLMTSMILLNCLGCNTNNNSSCEHNFEWRCDEQSHKKIYTCGCFSSVADILESHLDTDGNYICDICEYQMQKPASQGLELVKNNDGTNNVLILFLIFRKKLKTPLLENQKWSFFYLF